MAKGQAGWVTGVTGVQAVQERAASWAGDNAGSTLKEVVAFALGLEGEVILTGCGEGRCFRGGQAHAWR